jgi:hypothetical protein
MNDRRARFHRATRQDVHRVPSRRSGARLRSAFQHPRATKFRHEFRHEFRHKPSGSRGIHRAVTTLSSVGRGYASPTALSPTRRTRGLLRSVLRENPPRFRNSVRGGGLEPPGRGSKLREGAAIGPRVRERSGPLGTVAGTFVTGFVTGCDSVTGRSTANPQVRAADGRAW